MYFENTWLWPLGPGLAYGPGARWAAPGARGGAATWAKEEVVTTGNYLVDATTLSSEPVWVKTPYSVELGRGGNI
mgnify:CR=1 FL=1